MKTVSNNVDLTKNKYMKTASKKKRLEKFSALLSAAGLTFFLFGCEPPAAPPPPNSNVTVSNAAVNNAPANITADAPPKNEPAAKLSVTLPVLDAMFTDDAFGGELKSNLQLTDEQIEKIKQVSRESVSELNETDENSGSTRAAMERADRQIKEILGEEKAGKFAHLVNQRWSGDEAAANNSANNGANSAGEKSQPNNVPTDTRIVVNAPAYRMDVFQEGKLVKTYKIGIGYPEFPLPKGLRKADTIIFNPTWTPPDEPWVKGKLKPGKTVEAGSKDNPLGPIKIPIGLPSLIHGGKLPARLGGFASHGCVGLTNPQVQDFALELGKLSGLELTTADIKNYEKQKTETKNVKLDNPIPVELRYETIVVEDGKLKIFRDVYERGTNTEENLQSVLQAYGVSLDSLTAPEREKILAGLKQMAYDATGNPVEANANQNSSANAANSNTNNGNANKSNANKTNANDSKNESVTRTIKGKKEVSFDIAALKGKGYPAPVGMK